MNDDLDPVLEEHARTLLTLAAETVEPPSLAITPPPHRPVWPLVAAAAVVLLVAGVLAWRTSTTEQPAPAPDPVLTVPQTRWMSEEQATRTLTEAGLRVEITTVPVGACDLRDNRVLRSRPAAGEHVAPGQSVRIRIAEASYARGPSCIPIDGDAFGLLDLARFGTTDLAFADQVDVYVDGDLTRTLTHAEALDADAWGDPSPLTELVDHVADLGVRTTRDEGDQFACGDTDPPTALRGRPSTILDLAAQQGRSDFVIGWCEWVRVYRDDQGRIDAVTVSGRADRAQAETATAEPDPALDTGLKQAARGFAAFAAGGAAPEFAPEVRLLLGSRLVATVSAEEAADPSTWRLPCRAYAERSCPIDALEPLAEGAPYAVTPTVVRDYSACHEIDADLPADLTTDDALADSVSLSIPEPQMCMQNWEIQLWLDDGRISAANLILGAP